MKRQLAAMTAAWGSVDQPSERRVLTVVPGVEMAFRWIPPGTFTMGSPSGESGRRDDEGPQTRVTLTSGFWMGETAVTQRQYEAIVGTNPSIWKGDDLPVEHVSWDEATEFCRRLSERTRLRVRLPTEAEWEYACRAGTTTPFHFGVTISTDQANYDGYCTDKTTPVGSFPANAWGLHDMHGNVGEWCSDWWAAQLPGGSVTNPSGPSCGAYRVIRGGSCFNYPQWVRSAFRGLCDPVPKYEISGFRALVSPIAASPSATPSPARWGPGERPGERRRLSVAHNVYMAFGWIPPGTFTMGSPEPRVLTEGFLGFGRITRGEERGRQGNEGPQTRVTLTSGFWMGETGVTQRQYEAIVGSNPSHFKGADLPVEMVSWDEATEFCRRLSERTGLRVRLPTEAEWEYACRAGTTTPFHFGATISTDQANYDGRQAYGSGRKGVYRQKTTPVGSSPLFATKASSPPYRGKTTPVGSFPENTWELHDMHGNVWEWCSDWYADKLPGGSVTNPSGPSSGADRVSRGGSWSDFPAGVRSAARLRLTPVRRLNILGFRVVVSPTPGS